MLRVSIQKFKLTSELQVQTHKLEFQIHNNLASDELRFKL